MKNFLIVFIVVVMLVIFLIIFAINVYEKPTLFNEYKKLPNSDISSFSSIVDGYGWGYVKDKNNVFFYKGNNKEGYTFLVVDGADVDSFDEIYLHYAKDNSNVYWGNKIVDGVDVDSFEVYYFPNWSLEYGFARDKNNFYREGKKIFVANQDELIKDYFKFSKMNHFQLIK